MARHGSAPTEYQSPAAATPPGPTYGSGAATWPIRRKLTTLVALPTVVAIGLIGMLVAQSFLTWRQAERADRAAQALVLADAVTAAVDVELQRSTALLLKAPDAQAALEEQRKATDAALSALRADAEGIPDQQWSQAVSRRWAQADSVNQTLPSSRQLVDQQQVGLATVAQGYEVALQPIRDLVAELSTELGARTPNPRAVDASSVLTSVATAAAYASREIVLLTGVLNDNGAATGRISEIQQAAAGQTSLLELAATRATPEQRAAISDVRARDFEMATLRVNGLQLARTGSGAPTEESRSQALSFSTQASARLALLDDLVSSTATDLRDQTSGDARSALLRLILLSGLGLASLALISVLVPWLSRTITAPMRRLRSGAVDAATVRLPAAVRQIERDGPEAVVDIPPVLSADAKVGPETREVAQALDGLTGEAIRLATSQVRLRQSLDEAFVSMSRRSQAMVEKQLAIIDELESQEEDAEQLRNLFRLDHLAARMRRYNDNLLVLAGSAVRTRSSAPVPVADVFRAATSEMEQYERVRLQPLSGASVTGAAAGGLIHLIAELLDNAAMYSPPTSPIVLSAGYSEDGGLRLEVTDSGVGIPPTELAELNAQLAAPGAIDTQVPSRMGLYVVARLAQRGGFRVRLSARQQAAGTVAEVIVPKALVLGAPTGPLRAVPDAPPVTSPVEAPRLPSQLSGSLRSGSGVERERPTELPTVRPAHPAEPSVAGTAGGITTSGLPSRRPGAALAGNPLGARTPDQARAHIGTERGDPPRPPTTDSDPKTPQRSGSPFDMTPPWAAPQGDDTVVETGKPGDETGKPGDETGALPRRTPGSTRRQPAEFSTRARSGSPQRGITFEPQASVDAPGGAPAGLPSAPPGRRPGARPLPVRAPGQPGGGPAIGPSAATAVAAAAAARPRPTSAGSGLFAATGPSLESGTRSPAKQEGAGHDQGDGGAPPPGSEQVREQADTERSESGHEPERHAAAEPTAAEPTAFESEARNAASSRYRPTDPNAPMIGAAPRQPDRLQTPIFDSISVWFSDDRTATAHRPGEPNQVIDLRHPGRPPTPAGDGDRQRSGAPSGGRWASLGDQRWIAANARAASAPQTAGSTTAGLPRRRPGANLLPSATAAAGAPTVAAGPPARRTDAESVRGRLGSYQRGLSSARRARHLPREDESRGLFSANTESGQSSGRQGGDS